MTILIIDDEHLLLKHLNNLLLTINPQFKIVTFDNCEKGLEFVDNNKIDIAFLDIQMVGMTGVEFAEKLVEIWPKANIIFTTGYDNYAIDAFKLNASGYLLKPITKEAVEKSLNSLRYPIEETDKSKVRFQCFGNFEVFINEKPVEFKFSKTKELLAYLVYKRGSLCTNEEIITVLWEDDREHMSYFKQLRQDLDNTLCENNCEQILVRQRGKTGVLVEQVECDYYEYLKGAPATIKEFMSQYSWSEEITALL